RLSRRYISGRQLPDKAVSLLDTACGRTATSQHAIPADVEDARRRIEMIDLDLQVLGREERIGVEHGERLEQLQSDRVEAASALERLEAQRQRERALAATITSLYERL